MQLAENDQVFCESEMFSGEGIITFIDHNEIFGVQVQLNQPDPDGHRVKRFSFQEVSQKEDRVKQALPPGERMMADAATSKGNRVKGNIYFIQASTYSKNPQQIFYYGPHTEKVLGGCSISQFGNIRPIDRAEIEPVITKVEVTKKKKKSQASSEQLSFIF